MSQIAVVDGGCGFDNKMLAAVTHSLQRQLTEQFARPYPYGYGLTTSIRVAPLAEVRSDDLIVLLSPGAGDGNALGYHAVLPPGRPVIEVFPFLDANDGYPWSATVSHEVLEALVDPTLSLWAPDASGVAWAVEICDPVEQDVYWIDGFAVSNFVLPGYYLASSRVGPLDVMGRVQQPFEIRSGGYGQYWTGTGWMPTDDASIRPRRAALRIQGRRFARRSLAWLG